MNVLKSLSVAATAVTMLVTGTAIAQTPTATPASKAPAAAGAAATPATRSAKTPVVRTAKSLACSKQADAKSLHGKPRKGFMSQCKKT